MRVWGRGGWGGSLGPGAAVHSILPALTHPSASPQHIGPSTPPTTPSPPPPLHTHPHTPVQDNLALHAINFLTAVSRSVHHQLFEGADTLRQICESIVIPNLRMREDMVGGRGGGGREGERVCVSLPCVAVCLPGVGVGTEGVVVWWCTNAHAAAASV